MIYNVFGGVKPYSTNLSVFRLIDSVVMRLAG